jgi:hypothetical protein
VQTCPTVRGPPYGTALPGLVDDTGQRITTGDPYASTTPAEMRVALRIVVEGLQATRVVREHRGLPLGPDLPDVTSPATVLTPTPVSLGEQSNHRVPRLPPRTAALLPDASIAGNPVPGGYYRTPFWKKAMMIGGAVAGGEMLGDLLSGGGGYGGD